MTLDQLREKVAGFPDGPGVYLMKDDRGRVLYVGKAKSLRQRVGSYFQPSADHEPKVQALVEAVRDVEFLDAPSEVDALLAEARLIKDIQPKYNVQLKDDKSFPLLAISKNEDFPRVEVTRDVDPKNWQYFGPFANAGDLRAALKILQGVFKFRTCTIPIREGDDARRYFRPCILHSIRMCTAPCAALIGRESYAEDIESLKTILAGRRRELVRELEAKMKAAAEARRYERAAGFRDQLRAIDSLGRRGRFRDVFDGDVTPIDPREGTEGLRRMLGLAGTPRTVEGIDIAHLGGEDTVASLVSFVDGAPFKPGYRRYRIRSVEGIHDPASMREVVRRRFTRLVEEESVFPDVLLLDGGLGQMHAVEAEFGALGIRPPLLLALAKHEGDHLFRSGGNTPLEVDRRDPGFRLLQQVRDEAHRFAQHYHHLLRRKKLVGGEKPRARAAGRVGRRGGKASKGGEA
ncbi:MAG: excinuclease ABC subunit UvrC [Planctomycetes bacterium]|nr:excinuclease ABC subunit UvrC [Planctomycetota bacterium]